MIIMMALSVVCFGFIAWTRMPLKFLPDIDFPFIVCFVPYPGATPEQVEREIAIPAEGQFRTIPGLNRISTRSDGDGCRVFMRFDSDIDMSIASAEVRDRIERLKLTLPSDIDRIAMFKHNTNSLPVMGFLLFREGSEDEFVHLIRTVIKPRLERIEGVAEVQLMASTNEPEVLVEFDQNLLRTHNIALYEVISALQYANLNLSVGDIPEGTTKLYVRVLNEISRPEALAELIVSPSGLRLKEVAKVGFRTREMESHYDIDGKGGAFMLIRKESEANTVSTCRAVQDELDDLKTDEMFKSMEQFQFFNQSDLILTALNGLIDAGKAGGVMAFSVLFLFLLRVRHTLIVALAIPLSLVCAIVVMYFSGMTLNVVTMISLIVAVGMLVDNAIVVLENIYRYYQMGADVRVGAERGASEVGVAIVASTITTVVVFVPVLYMEGGDLAVQMRQFAIPMSTALFASLLVALTIIPLATCRLKQREDLKIYKLWMKLKPRLVRERAPDREVSGWRRLVQTHPFTHVAQGYFWVLGLAVRRRLVTMILVAVVCVMTFFIRDDVGMTDMPTLDLRQVDLDVELDQNFDMAMARETFDRLKAVIQEAREELDIKNVFSHFDRNNGSIEIYLMEPEDYPPGQTAKYSTEQVYAILSERLPDRIPGAKLDLYLPESGQEQDEEQSISIRLRGDDTARLSEYAENLRKLMATVPDLENIQVSSERARQEVQLKIDQALAEREGISPAVVARTVDVALRGNRLPYMKQAGREFSVWAQFKEEDRKSRDNLDNVAVMSLGGSLVPLKQLVDYTKAESPTSILRIDGKNVVTITARSTAKDLQALQNQLMEIVNTFELPLGYTIDFGDAFREMNQSMSNFWTSIILGILLIYIVMSALFESLLLPVSIMMSVVLAFIGAYWGLYITSTPLDTIGMIGCILMVGVVVNNGIVLVDHINFLRKVEGKERTAAVLQGGRDRLRPVMMTALTTILGCVPLALTPEAGTTVSFVSLGRALIGGLVSGTVLTLVIVPMLYTVIDDMREWFVQYAASLVRLGNPRQSGKTESPLSESIPPTS